MLVHLTIHLWINISVYLFFVDNVIILKQLYFTPVAKWNIIRNIKKGACMNDEWEIDKAGEIRIKDTLQ